MALSVRIKLQQEKQASVLFKAMILSPVRKAQFFSAQKFCPTFKTLATILEIILGWCALEQIWDLELVDRPFPVK